MKTKIEKNYFNELVDDFGRIENVPVWAISYLVNGDASYLSDEEIAECERWQTGMQEAGMLHFELLHVNDKREYTDDTSCPLASGFGAFTAFGKGYVDYIECLIITGETCEALSRYRNKMAYIEINDFDAVVYNPQGLNYGERTYNVYFANDYGYRVHNFLVENVDSEGGALEEVARYCRENNLVDECYIFSAERFEELCKEEFGECSYENDGAYYDERLDMLYVDPDTYFDTVHLGFKEVA